MVNINIKYVGFAFVFLAVLYLATSNYFSNDKVITSEKLADNIENFEKTKKIYLQTIDTNEETTKTEVLTLSNDTFDIQTDDNGITYLINVSAVLNKETNDDLKYFYNTLKKQQCDYLKIQLKASNNTIYCYKEVNQNGEKKLVLNKILAHNEDSVLKIVYTYRSASDLCKHYNYKLIADNYDVYLSLHESNNGCGYDFKNYNVILYSKKIDFDASNVKRIRYTNIQVAQDNVGKMLKHIKNVLFNSEKAKITGDKKYTQAFGKIYNVSSVNYLKNAICFYNDKDDYLAIYSDALDVNATFDIKEYDEIDFENIFSALYYNFVQKTLKTLNLVDADKYYNTNAYFEKINIYQDLNNFNIFSYNVSFTALMSFDTKNEKYVDEYTNCVYDEEKNKYKCVFINKNLVKNETE